MEQPSGTVSFLFSDIEGSTQLLAKLGAERYAAALEDHRSLMREAFREYDGFEVDCEGDAFFVAFQTAAAAVACATEAHQSLAAHGWPDDGTVRVRVGIHTGEPLLAAQNYVGMDVHRAARIMAAAHGGQTVLSQTTRDLIAGQFELRDLGEHRLKDLSGPQRLYQLGSGEFPRLKTLPRSNLPVPVSSFLGREREVEEIMALLSDGTRLLTLTGPGGTGKTRLALQAAAEAADVFPDGVWWVPLAPLRDPELVLSELGRVLEVSEEPGRELADTLAERLEGPKTLLLLDNAEHLLPTIATRLSSVVARSAARFLITSRERLQLAGERAYPVATLEEATGIELFLERAAEVGSPLEESDTVRELCARLDLLPLALELAAARTVLFTPLQLLERLGQRLDLLRSGRDSDPRQQTLRAAIEWSFDLLTSEEQSVFCALSIFAGDSSYEAAESVAGADPDTLQSLMDKSLVRRRDTPSGSRYWMLETIREYGSELLLASGRADEVGSRHLAYFVEIAEATELGARTGDRAVEFARLDAESGNIRAAIEWARTKGCHESELRLASALWGYWVARGLISEGRRWLEDALAAASESPPRALVGLSVLRHLSAEETRKVLAEATAALEACEIEGDEYSLAQAWNVIGRLEGSGLSNAQTGEAAWYRALEYAERGGYRAERADSMGWLMVMTVFGPLPTDAGIERCTQFFERAGDDPSVRAFAQVERAVLEAMRGDFDVARDLLAAGHDALLQLGLNVWAANNGQEAYFVEMLAGNPSGAVETLRASYAALDEMGERGFLSTIAALLAHALYAQGADVEAELYTRHSEAAAAPDDVFSQVLWRSARAKVYARRGDAERGEALVREAIELNSASDNLNGRADLFSDLAEVLALAGRHDEARTARLQAAALYDQKGNLAALANARRLLAGERAGSS